MGILYSVSKRSILEMIKIVALLCLASIAMADPEPEAAADAVAAADPKADPALLLYSGYYGYPYLSGYYGGWPYLYGRKKTSAEPTPEPTADPKADPYLLYGGYYGLGGLYGGHYYYPYGNGYALGRK